MKIENIDELKEISFPGTDIHIPLLQEVLELVKGKVMIVVEIKRTKIISYQDYCMKVFSILKDYPYDFVVKSFDIRIVNWFLRHTKYITGLLVFDPKKSFYNIK